MRRLVVRRLLGLNLLVAFVACGPPADAPPPFEEWSAAHPQPEGFVLLGEDTRDVSENGSLTLAFELPAGATSIEISAATRSDLYLQVTSIRTPTGEVHVPLEDATFSDSRSYVTEAFLEAHQAQNPTIARRGSAAFRYPNDAFTTLEPGAWSITVTSFDVDLVRDPEFRVLSARRQRVSDTLHVKAFARMGELSEGVIDLHILLGPGTGFEASTAAADEVMMSALGIVDRVFALQNVRVREVFFEDVASFPTRAALVPETCDQSQVVRDIAGQVSVRGGYVPIAMIGGFICQVRSSGGQITNQGQGIGGFSPGIPGVYSTEGEALVLSTELLRQFPDIWSVVLAHEVGHFLGLMHTVQPGLNLDDNLVDTEASSNNIMFPAAYEIYEPFLTDMQGTVIRQSPYVQQAP
ncbi:MAG: hypothetical protein ACI9KE_001362 [Polyangiales bacterium]|jgi:hypothetical protein